MRGKGGQETVTIFRDEWPKAVEDMLLAWKVFAEENYGSKMSSQTLE